MYSVTEYGSRLTASLRDMFAGDCLRGVVEAARLLALRNAGEEWRPRREALRLTQGMNINYAKC